MFFNTNVNLMFQVVFLDIGKGSGKLEKIKIKHVVNNLF